MVISDGLRSEIETRMTDYPQPRGALLPALHLVQRDHGHLTAELCAELAALFGIRALEVAEVVSFYNLFYDQPQGRHHVYVCTNLSCSLRGARVLLRALEAHLGIRVGETTGDARVTLGREACLGACAGAPMLRVGETYHEDLDLETALSIVDGLE